MIREEWPLSRTRWITSIKCWTSSLKLQLSRRSAISMENVQHLNLQKNKKYKIYNSIWNSIYGNSKVYKTNKLLRLIVSGLQELTSKLSQLLSDLWTPAYNKDDEHYFKDNYSWWLLIELKPCDTLKPWRSLLGCAEFIWEYIEKIMTVWNKNGISSANKRSCL